MTSASATPPIGEAARTSDLLQRAVTASDSTRVTLAELLGALGERGFGVLIVLLVLPNLIPGPAIPGYSLPFGLGVAWVATQMMRGFARPMLPGWLQRRSFDRARLARLLARALPSVRRLERYAHARPSFWTTRRSERWVGMIAGIVGVALAMPVPFANAPPALALLVAGLGLIERDSLLLAVGLLGGLVSTIYVAVLTGAAWMAATQLLR